MTEVGAETAASAGNSVVDAAARRPRPNAPAVFEPAAEQSQSAPDESVTGGILFCGDTGFFSLNRALQIIANQKLTGTLRLFWDKAPVELLVQNGQVLFATSRDPGSVLARKRR